MFYWFLRGLRKPTGFKSGVLGSITAFASYKWGDFFKLNDLSVPPDPSLKNNNSITSVKLVS